MKRRALFLAAATAALALASSANAQLLLGVSRGGGSAEVFGITYANSFDANTAPDGSNNYTSGAIGIGAPFADRVVCVTAGATYATTGTILGVTFNPAGTPISASAISNDTTTNRIMGAFCGSVPTGTTVVVQVNMSGASQRVATDIYYILGTSHSTFDQRSGSTPTTNAGAAVTTASFTPTSSSCAVIFSSRNGGTGTTAWTSSSGTPSKDTDRSVGTSMVFSSGRATVTGAAVTYTSTGTGGPVRGLAFSWCP